MAVLRFKREHPNARIPTYGSAGAACFDLYAATVEGASAIGSPCYEGSTVLCDTGLAVEVPDGMALMVYSRSGHGFNHLIRLANSVGVIDSDYRGTVKVLLVCDEPDDDGPPVLIKPGDRVAQAMLIPVDRYEFEEVDALTETIRGTNGLGSTGA
jgi:dUTP pyrophosphatase